MAGSLRVLACTVAVVAFAALASAPAAAQAVVTRISRMDGAQHVPPTASTSIGLGVFSIDTVANTLTYRVSRTGSGLGNSHLRGYAPPGMTAPILHALPSGTTKCGVWSYPAADEANLLAGLAYVNLHGVSAQYVSGELRGQVAETWVHANTCLGDGSGTACPCANHSVPADEEGCLNALSRGGRLRGYGTASLSNDRLVLHHSRATNSNVLVFRGTTLAGGGAGTGFGDGKRCASGAVVRHSVKLACLGQAMWPEPGTPDIGLGTGVGVPGTYHYQAWFRDANPYCTASTFNLSNAVSVAWGP